MLYSEFITKLRRELKDFAISDKYIVGDKWNGDGSNKLFFSTFAPIKSGSYSVYVGGSLQTETTHYSLDSDTGLLTFVTAPTAGNDNVELRYQYYKIKDADYIEIINDAIDNFRWKFWKMDIDTTTLTTVKSQYEYDCSGITGILYVLNAWLKTSSSATVWEAIQSLTNWKYYTRLQKLYVDPALQNDGFPMKLLYLKSLTKGDEVTDTLDIPTEWLLPYKYYIYARFYERQVAEKVGETAAITTLPSYTPAQVMINITEFYYKKAEEVANRIAPKLPPMAIKQLSGGVTL